MTYINEVAPACRWKWLTKRLDIVHPKYYSTGTASVAQDSTTVIISSAIAASKANMFFAVNGYPEIYTISAHTAASDTLTLSTAFTGETNAAINYKIWTEYVALPTDCRETVDVRHDWSSRVMIPQGPQKLDDTSHMQRMREDRPLFYSTDDFFDPTSGTAETEDDRYRQMRVWPALYNKNTTLHVTYVQEVDALNLDADEPLLPIEDRIILVYGALKQAWIRERNAETAAINAQLFASKLDAMKARYEDATDMPILEVDSTYTVARRVNWRRNI
jgi:hypothetical protein